MKTPKIPSYIRLVAGFFMLFAVFFIGLLLVVNFRIMRNILPFYVGERHEMVLRIKEEILREAELDPHFDLTTFLAKHNARFIRLRLGFIPDSLIRRKNGSLELKPPGNRQKLIDAIPLNLKGIRGYLVLYPNRFRALSGTVNNLMIFMLITLLPSLVIGFIIFQRIYRRSSILVEAVGKVSQGDYSVRVNMSGNDEYSQIGKAFNEMAASIERSTLELKAMDIQRRQFIADISHELATPLTSLKGYIETLRMEELNLKPEEQRQYLNIIWDEAERLSFLVKDLLELARMEAGTIKLECDRIDCREFMKSFATRNALQLKQRGISLTWTAHSTQLILADYRRLEQIIQNLLDNALKHSDGLTQLTVEFSEELQKTRIVFRDDGMGIASDHINHLFERFYKVNGELVANDGRQYGGGSGLGLSIVKGLMELHGGRIAIESNLGQGTAFIMEFPKGNPKGAC